MEKVCIEMPRVSDCMVTNCTYNLEKSCHARAITIGDSKNPNCDTFLNGSTHCKEKSQSAGVGACKVSHCKFNDDFECNAENISVGFSGKSTYCLTFKV
ncbi:MAG: hypothetical protein A2X86_08395 [Bdellovibrionales bacterium GWA2_49_15]|nr:MAG: hypothetical protein A2X86_08395 [Bdellovibrionales bacterium GWA2_49_15]HAZ11219.1 DUF1540 domain-containing protein [Bdellovibrionales bacterium]